MRVWFLEEKPSICPGCSTGCNIWVDQRDGEAQRLRPRRNVEVNKSWMCDYGRVEYKGIALETRITGARARVEGGAWTGLGVESALDTLAHRLKEAGAASAFMASPQATNEDLFAFRTLAETVGGRLDFRVGDPQLKVRQRADDVLLRVDRNPNTQGCLDQGLGRSGVAQILAACAAGEVKALVLQGPELLQVAQAAEALARVPFIAILASHESPVLDRVHLVLPAALWAEVDGTFTNYQRRVQRLRAAVPPLGEARPGRELLAGVVQRLGVEFPVTAREIFARLAPAVAGYEGLSYKALGSTGRALPLDEAEANGAAPEARA
jgi:NADH-quinone oxidoreductase subunit G